MKLQCRNCLVYKSEDNFFKSARYKKCKECINSRRKKLYATDLGFNTRYKQRANQWARKNPEKMRRYHLRYSFGKKKLVIEHYSKGTNCCACCGENIFEFLCIDHVGGKGNDQRRAIGHSGNMFYQWLIKNAYPGGFRVLCHNCNLSMGNMGGCPHKSTTIYSEFLTEQHII